MSIYFLYLYTVRSSLPSIPRICFLPKDKINPSLSHLSLRVAKQVFLINSFDFSHRQHRRFLCTMMWCCWSKDFIIKVNMFDDARTVLLLTEIIVILTYNDVMFVYLFVTKHVIYTYLDV